MSFAWEHLVWRRSSRLQIDLPIQGPSLETLIQVIAKNHVYIAHFELAKLAATLAFEPNVFSHKPAVVDIVIRTKNRTHEEQILRTLSGFGYRYQRGQPTTLNPHIRNETY